MNFTGNHKTKVNEAAASSNSNDSGKDISLQLSNASLILFDDVRPRYIQYTCI